MSYLAIFLSQYSYLRNGPQLPMRLSTSIAHKSALCLRKHYSFREWRAHVKRWRAVWEEMRSRAAAKEGQS
jgi:hypothetical protein